MTDLSDLFQSREQLSKRLASIEAALADLQQDAARMDADIAAAQRVRREMTKRGRRMYALLRETRRDLERQDALIQACAEEIAAAHIGAREGVYLMGPSTGSGRSRFAVARVVAGGVLYTSLVEVVEDG